MNGSAVIFVSFLFVTGLAAQKSIDVQSFRRPGDDDSKMLKRALKTQHKGGLYFPSNLILHAPGYFNVPPGLALQGGGHLVGTKLVLGGNGSVSGLTFEGAQAGLVIDRNGYQSTEMIRSVTFRNADIAIQIPAGADGKTAKAISIAGNVCEACKIFILSDRLSDSLIRDNSVHVSDRGILLFGGSDNRIVNNTIDGGLTGINFVYNFEAAGETGLVRNNVIQDNTISNVREESISFDTRGNEPTRMAVREIDLIAEATPSGVALRSAGWNAVGANMHHLYLCWMSGHLKGTCIQSIGGSDSRFMLNGTPSQMASIKPGDQVVVGAPFLANAIYGNTIHINADNKWASGILLWGMAYGNIVCGNSIESNVTALSHFGIGIVSLDGLDSTGSVVPPQGGRKAPSEGNFVAHNRITNLKLTLGYEDWGNQRHFASTGNRLLGNKLTGGRIEVTDQEQTGQSPEPSQNSSDYETKDIPVDLIASIVATRGSRFCRTLVSKSR